MPLATSHTSPNCITLDRFMSHLALEAPGLLTAPSIHK